jgi:catechol 2,3-dioxygenase-like lactoylglutathione lyase family enzyme
MTVTRIDHVQLAMPAGGEPKAREFYHGVLGVPERPKPPDMAARGGCWFESGDLKIHLGVDPEFRPARKAHPGLLVTELRSLAEKLRAGGYTFREDGAMEGYARIFVDDPFGNRIELLEPRGDSSARG